MKNLFRLCALASLLAPTLAAAADEAPCLQPAEFAAFSAYALPSAIRGAQLRCDPVLGKAAFLATGGDKLAARYDAGKAAAWPTAKAAFLKIGSDRQTAELFRTLPDQNLQPLVDSLITGMVVQQLPADRCAALDRLLMLLSPLPPSSTSEIVTIVFDLAGRDGRAKIGKFAVCPR